jgi:hypothetical protein
MGDRTSIPVEAQLIRVQRVLDEALDRFVGRDEAERVDGLAAALHAELVALPPSARDPLLAALAAAHPAPVAVAAPAADGGERRRLEQENARLREALAAAQARVPDAPTADPTAAEVVKILVGPARRPGAARPPGSEERALAVLRALVEFLASVARTYLGVGLDADRTMAGHFHAVVADEIEGKRPAGTVKKLLDQMRFQMGNQVLAFRGACDTGARELLRQLDPEAIAAEADTSRRFFAQGKYWEAFQARYQELQRADDLFQVYFEVAWKRITRELMNQAARGEAEG